MNREEHEKVALEVLSKAEKIAKLLIEETEGLGKASVVLGAVFKMIVHSSSAVSGETEEKTRALVEEGFALGEFVVSRGIERLPQNGANDIIKDFNNYFNERKNDER